MMRIMRGIMAVLRDVIVLKWSKSGDAWDDAGIVRHFRRSVGRVSSIRI